MGGDGVAPPGCSIGLSLSTWPLAQQQDEQDGRERLHPEAVVCVGLCTPRICALSCWGPGPVGSVIKSIAGGFLEAPAPPPPSSSLKQLDGFPPDFRDQGREVSVVGPGEPHASVRLCPSLTPAPRLSPAAPPASRAAHVLYFIDVELNSPN